MKNTKNWLGWVFFSTVIRVENKFLREATITNHTFNKHASFIIEGYMVAMF